MSARSKRGERHRRTHQHRIRLPGNIRCSQRLPGDLYVVALRAYGLLFAVANHDLHAVLARILRREGKGILRLIGQEVDFLAFIVEHEGIAIGFFSADGPYRDRHLIIRLDAVGLQSDLCDLQGMPCHGHFFRLRDFRALCIPDHDIQRISSRFMEHMPKRCFLALRGLLLHQEGIRVRRKTSLGCHSPGDLLICHQGNRITGKGCDCKRCKRNLKSLVGELRAVALLVHEARFDGHAADVDADVKHIVSSPYLYLCL